MRWLVRGLLTVGGWLYCFLGLSSASAENVGNPCSVHSSPAVQLFSGSPLAMRLASEGSESFFEVRCSGKSSGMLKLSIDGSRTKTYSNSAKIRLVTANGIFGSGSSEFTSSALQVPYSASDDSGVGKVTYQVQISVPDRRLLRAANDYSVTVNAELLP